MADMNEITFDLSDSRFDFSTDSLVRESLLGGILSRGADSKGARIPVSLDELAGSSQRLPKNPQPGREHTPPGKGRGI
ncbi:MAG: hypothetical protein FWH00_00445 [Oscillospiraceae bacterium]|nr:hypothetical protein [Oscillospiraceae bacterium]